MRKILKSINNASLIKTAYPEIWGVDFTSRPTKQKPITLARGRVMDGSLGGTSARALGGTSGLTSGLTLALTAVQRLPTFAAFETCLVEPGAWVAAFDFPFGLPRAFAAEIGWLNRASTWASLTRKLTTITRAELTAHCRAYCDARPVGAKLAHRPVDRLAGSSASMKWVNPPVVYMLQEGAPRLLAAGVHVPGQQVGDENRIALEAYPGYLARSIIGKTPYKNDQRAKQTPALAKARRAMIAKLVDGDYSLAIPIAAPKALIDAMQNDASGDTLDAALCALQAAWAWQRREDGFGLPPDMDALEGWIATVPFLPMA